MAHLWSVLKSKRPRKSKPDPHIPVPHQQTPSAVHEERQFAHLPTELYRPVVECLSNDQGALHSLLLVSKYFHTEVEHLVWTAPDLRNPEAHAKFTESVSQFPRVAALVQDLAFDVGSDAVWEEPRVEKKRSRKLSGRVRSYVYDLVAVDRRSHPIHVIARLGFESWSNLALTLLYLPNLKHLTIRQRGIVRKCRLGNVLLDAPFQLQSLRITFRFRDEDPSFYAFLENQTSIEALHLDMFLGSREPPPVPPLTSLPNLTTFSSSVREALRILPGPMENLTHIKLTRSPQFPLTMALRLFPKLQVLVIDFTPPADLGTHLPTLRYLQCPLIADELPNLLTCIGAVSTLQKFCSHVSGAPDMTQEVTHQRIQDIFKTSASLERVALRVAVDGVWRYMEWERFDESPSILHEAQVEEDWGKV